MKTVVNKTVRPIKVHLPQGKVLHLGPKKSGQIADQAVDHPGVKHLVDSKEIEILDEGKHPEKVQPRADRPHEFTHGFAHEEKHTRGDR